MPAETVAIPDRFLYAKPMNGSLAKLARPAVLVIVVIGLIAFSAHFLRGGSVDGRYVTATVTRGPIVRSVIATGTVNPVVTVQVGSYVSGPIQAIYADFNARVKAGELIAKIDPRPFEVKVAESQAALANARAQLSKDIADTDYKKITFQRNQRLYDAEAVSHDVLDSARSVYLQGVSQVALDRANIQQQKAAVQDAQVQLNYTDIVSPVDGTVVSRNVDVGQTVAASFQTPMLFLIANDLTHMQVDTSVSESDIGNVLDGENGEFKVDAFPDRTFEGGVFQVRQAPITVQNVVTYDVVVRVANPELLLKPGMTANVTIVTARRDDVIRVPQLALRFAPRGGGTTAAATPHSQRDKRVFRLEGGRLTPVAITTGLDDGNNVELISGDLKPDDVVVTDELRNPAAASGTPPSFGGSPHMAR